MYYKICPLCGANLDPGEVCDCEEQRAQEATRIREWIERIQEMMEEGADGQLKMAV